MNKGQNQDATAPRAIPFWLLQALLAVELWELGLLLVAPEQWVVGLWPIAFAPNAWADPEQMRKGVFMLLMCGALPVVLNYALWELLRAHCSTARRKKLRLFFALELLPGVNFVPFFLLWLRQSRALGVEASPAREPSGRVGFGLSLGLLVLDLFETLFLATGPRGLRTPFWAERVYRDFADHSEDYLTALWYVIPFLLPAALGIVVGTAVWRRSLPWRRKKLAWFLLLEAVPVLNWLPFFVMGIAWTSAGAKRELELFGPDSGSRQDG